jgi:hypothetical protein
LFLLVNFLLLSAQVDNLDKPAKGEYLFGLDKIWVVDQVGEDLWGTIFSVIVADDGKVCCYDWKNLKYYILDENGKLLASFGKKGEGPGEIKRIVQAPIYNAGDKIAVADTGQLHFFDWQGQYIRTNKNVSQNRPIIFLDEDTYITAPRSALAVGDGQAKVEQINLKTMERKLITNFSMYKGGTIANRNAQAAVVFGGITPQAVVNFSNNRLFYGMSDIYRIYVTDMQGNPQLNFSLKREKGEVKQKDIVDRLVERAKGRAPRELLERLAKTLPTKETYFRRIILHQELIYVLKSDFYGTNVVQIDIFTPSGKYLYRGLIKVEEGNTIRVPTFKGNYLYLVLEDEDGENSLCKYLVTHPRG